MSHNTLYTPLTRHVSLSPFRRSSKFGWTSRHRRDLRRQFPPTSFRAFSREKRRDFHASLEIPRDGNKVRIWLALERDVIDARGELREEISLSFHDKCWSRFRREGKAWFDQPVTYYAVMQSLLSHIARS